MKVKQLKLEGKILAFEISPNKRWLALCQEVEKLDDKNQGKYNILVLDLNFKENNETKYEIFLSREDI